MRVGLGEGVVTGFGELDGVIHLLLDARMNRRDGRFNGLAILVDQLHAFTRSAVPAP